MKKGSPFLRWDECISDMKDANIWVSFQILLPLFVVILDSSYEKISINNQKNIIEHETKRNTHTHTEHYLWFSVPSHTWPPLVLPFSANNISEESESPKGKLNLWEGALKVRPFKNKWAALHIRFSESVAMSYLCTLLKTIVFYSEGLLDSCQISIKILLDFIIDFIKPDHFSKIPSSFSSWGCISFTMYIQYILKLMKNLVAPNTFIIARNMHFASNWSGL